MKKTKNSDLYFEKFDLTKDPFPVDSYDNILFLTPELTNRIQQIKKLIAETDKLIVVSSVFGAGKSSLADYLESIKEKNWKACLVRAISDMDRETLAYEIIQQVSPDKADEKGMSVPQLYKFLEFSSKTESLPVFIIDDADKLPLNTLEFILELSAIKYQETSYHFVLFANEAVTDKLNNENLLDLTSQLVTYLHLPSLSLTQLKEYIDNRLGSCGEINEYPFTDSDIEDIYNISGGLPRGVNNLARQKMIDKITPKPGSNVLLKVSAAAVIIIVLVVGFYYTSMRNDDSTQTQAVINAAPPQPSSLPVVASPPPPIELTIPQQEELSIPIAQQNEQDIIEPIMDVEVEQVEAEVIIEQVTSIETNMAEAVIATPASPIEIETTSVQEEQMVIESPEPEIVTNPQDITDDQEQQALLVENENLDRNLQTSSTVDNVASNTGENIYKLDSIPQELRGLKGESWFRQQPSSSYVLQLISASELDNVLSLIEGLEDFHEDLSGYVKYTPSGRPRYLLFFGIYTDRDTASNSSSSMPEKLRPITPYPRSIGSIIDEIEELGDWPR